MEVTTAKPVIVDAGRCYYIRAFGVLMDVGAARKLATDLQAAADEAAAKAKAARDARKDPVEGGGRE